MLFLAALPLGAAAAPSGGALLPARLELDDTAPAPAALLAPRATNPPGQCTEASLAGVRFEGRLR